MELFSFAAQSENKLYFQKKGDKMTKGNKTVFVCNECGYENAKWLGKCPACNSWNTFFEQKVDTYVEKGVKKVKERNEPKKLNSYEGKEAVRITTGIDELDRVLGGGLVKGSLILLRRRARYRKIHANTANM